MMLCLLVVCFIVPCLSARTEPDLNILQFEHGLVDIFRDVSNKFESKKPFTAINQERNNCYHVQTLNFTCLETNITVSMKTEKISTAFNGEKLFVDIYLEFEGFYNTNVKVIKNMNGKILEKYGVLQINFPKLYNNINSTYLYRVPIISGLLKYNQNMTLPQVDVILKDLDIGQENIKIAQNAIRSQFREAISESFKSIEIHKVEQFNTMKEVYLGSRARFLILYRLLEMIKKSTDSDMSTLFA